MGEMEFGERLLAYGEIVETGFCTNCGTAYVQLKGYEGSWAAGNGETECGEPIGLCCTPAVNRPYGHPCNQRVRITTLCGRVTQVTTCGGDIWTEGYLDSGYDPLKELLDY